MSLSNGLLEWPQVYELDLSLSQSLLACSLRKTLHITMDAKYFQIIFFIIALIITLINVYDRFFTKRVINNMGCKG